MWEHKIEEKREQGGEVKTDFLSIYSYASFQYVLRFTLSIDTLVQSLFNSLQFGKEVN